ncbi:MAG: hypothetical protein WC766_06290 [Patescibacteria group bacterium]
MASRGWSVFQVNPFGYKPSRNSGRVWSVKPKMTTIKLLFKHNEKLTNEELILRGEQVRQECAGPAGSLKPFGITVEAEGDVKTNSTLVTFACPSRIFKKKALKKKFLEKVPFMEKKTNSTITFLEEQEED